MRDVIFSIKSSLNFYKYSLEINTEKNFLQALYIIDVKSFISVKAFSTN